MKTMFRLTHYLKMWLAGHSRFSRCWMGLHKWDYPGGHCERCDKCDEFFNKHTYCRELGTHR